MPREHNPLAGHGASFSDFKRCFKSIIRGSTIGVVLGAIPGIGGAPSAFLSYSEAKRTSPNSDNFGKGEIEGVAAAESGTNRPDSAADEGLDLFGLGAELHEYAVAAQA